MIGLFSSQQGALHSVDDVLVGFGVDQPAVVHCEGVENERMNLGYCRSAVAGICPFIFFRSDNPTGLQLNFKSFFYMLKVLPFLCYLACLDYYHFDCPSINLHFWVLNELADRKPNILTISLLMVFYTAESILKGDHVKDRIKINTSSYCNYNKTFTVYDQLRQPNGLRELLQIFKQTNIPIEKQKVLEGGFGTGAYIDHIRHYVKEIHGVEGSSEGFEQALQKIEKAANVHLQIGNILSLTFADDSFHADMVNQVLHHLDNEPGYPNLNVFLKESMRVLKPGGVLTINTSSQEQLDPHWGVYWSYKYIEKAARAMQARFIPADELISRMDKLGFTDINTTIPSGKIFHEQYYNDPCSVLELDFQKGDSVYCFLSQEEIEEANERIRSGIADGSVNMEMKRAAERAAEIGEAVIISARTV